MGHSFINRWRDGDRTVERYCLQCRSTKCNEDNVSEKIKNKMDDLKKRFEELDKQRVERVNKMQDLQKEVTTLYEEELRLMGAFREMQTLLDSPAEETKILELASAKESDNGTAK